MSRLIRYKESLSRFINEKSSILKSLPDDSVIPHMQHKIKDSDYILSILFLTTMNSQNKRNKVLMQGYYIASGIEMLQLLLDLIEHEHDIVEKYNQNIYHKLTNFLIIISQKMVCMNLDSVKRFLSPELTGTVFLNIMSHYNDAISYNTLFRENLIEVTDGAPHQDLLRWYIKDDTELQNKFSELKQVNRESLTNYINNKIGTLCELAVCLGWMIGCGEDKDLSKVKKISKYFTMFYALSKNFMTIEEDIKNSKNRICLNYVVNFGLQDSYELFMYNKEKFIEETMILDIYTSTVKEIVDYVESRVDQIIDKTEPDLKSNWSVK
jgi:hypothetical protein